jgi:hypothetical protein
VSGPVKPSLHVQAHGSQSAKDVADKPFDATAVDNLAALVAELQEIDIDSPMAKLNETSISDNNGGRIEL